MAGLFALKKISINVNFSLSDKWVVNTVWQIAVFFQALDHCAQGSTTYLHHHIVVDIDVVVDVVDGVVLDVAVVYVVDVQPVVVNTVANTVVFLGILMSYDDRIRIFRNDVGPETQEKTLTLPTLF